MIVLVSMQAIGIGSVVRMRVVLVVVVKPLMW